MGNNIDRPNIAGDDQKKSFVERIEAKLREKESEKGAFMKRCAVINDEIKSILDEAKGAGLPKAAVKGVIKVREYQRKAEAIREELEADDEAIFVSIQEALGDFADLPLGAAAVAKDQGKPDATTAAIIGAVLGDEAAQEAKATPEEVAAQRARDAEEFDKADAEKQGGNGEAPAETASIDPKAARAARSARRAPVERGLSEEPGHVQF